MAQEFLTELGDILLANRDLEIENRAKQIIQNELLWPAFKDLILNSSPREAISLATDSIAAAVVKVIESEAALDRSNVLEEQLTRQYGNSDSFSYALDGFYGLYGFERTRPLYVNFDRPEDCGEKYPEGAKCRNVMLKHLRSGYLYHLLIVSYLIDGRFQKHTFAITFYGGRTTLPVSLKYMYPFHLRTLFVTLGILKYEALASTPERVNFYILRAFPDARLSFKANGQAIGIYVETTGRSPNPNSPNEVETTSNELDVWITLYLLSLTRGGTLAGFSVG